MRSFLPVLALATAPVFAPDWGAADVQPFVGEIQPMALTNFCPNGWAEANGQLLAISSNDTLFSLLGTIYGGDGVSTFALPDLRGRIPLGSGSGPGLSPRREGEKGGQETVTLNGNQLAAHSHMVNATNKDGNFPGPGDKILAAAPDGGSGAETIYSDQPANATMSSSMISPSGGGQSFPVQDPSLVIRYCVALFGIYPSRN
ncbi:MAG: tail fiber protein [Sulfitobacter sp.]